MSLLLQLLLYFSYFMLAYVAATIMLYLASFRAPTMAFYARLLASYMSLMIAATYGVIAAVIAKVLGYGLITQYSTARTFQLLMSLSTGVSFKVEGAEHLKIRPAVFVAPHQSELDVLMLGATFPPYCSVTAKKSLKYIPIFGWFMSLSGTVFIDRSNRKNAMAAFDDAAGQMIRMKQSVFIFPEGTRSYFREPDLLPFKKGAFHLAVKAKVPIIPIVVANYSNILDVRSKKFTSGKIPVKVLPPVYTEHLTTADVDDLSRDVRASMLQEMKLLTEKERLSGLTVPKIENSSKKSSAAKSTAIEL